MYFEDYKIGKIYKDIEPIEFTEKELIYYGEKYDPRPIHTDREAAKASSFGEIISPGSFSNMVFWGQWVKTEIDKEGMIAGIGIKNARWHKPVFANVKYRIEVEILDKKIWKEGKHGEVSFMMRAYNPEGELVSEYSPYGLVKCRVR